MTQKKFCFAFLTLIAGVFLQTYAQTVEVSALDSFSTENPPTSISIKLEEPLTLSNTQVLGSGTVLKGDLIDVISPKRLKRDATFSFKPICYIDLNGKKHNINSNIIASYTKLIDKTKLATSAALSVGSYFVKGLSMSVAAVEGAVKNEEGNRLKSSAVSVYEATPLSYTQKGEDLCINSGDIFFLKFPQVVESENVQENKVEGQNYSFTIEKE